MSARRFWVDGKKKKQGKGNMPIFLVLNSEYRMKGGEESKEKEGISGLHNTGQVEGKRRSMGG